MTLVWVEGILGGRVSVALGCQFTFLFHLRRHLSSRNSYLLSVFVASLINNSVYLFLYALWRLNNQNVKWPSAVQRHNWIIPSLV